MNEKRIKSPLIHPIYKEIVKKMEDSDILEYALGTKDGYMYPSSYIAEKLNYDIETVKEKRYQGLLLFSSLATFLIKSRNSNFSYDARKQYNRAILLARLMK